MEIFFNRIYIFAYSLVPNEYPLFISFWKFVTQKWSNFDVKSVIGCRVNSVHTFCCQNYFLRKDAHLRPCFASQ